MNSFEKLKKDIKSGEIGNFYIFFGVEDYMKNFYLEKIESSILDENFKDFNFEKYDEISFKIDDFENSIESLPAMSDKKLIIVRNVDLFKLKTDEKEKIQEILNDLPDYVCVIFDYFGIEYKPDNRQKLAKIIKEKCEVVEFEYLSLKDLNSWIIRKFSAYNLKISSKTLEYFTFMCSVGMTNLSSEIEKLSAYSTEEVTTKDIDAVCSKVLEARIFDITDKIIKNDINGAKNIVFDLLMLKTDEFAIISVINSQFCRLYSAKIGLNRKLTEKFFSTLWSLHSPYAVKLILNQARVLELDYLKKVCFLTVNASMDLVSKNVDKTELIYDLIVSIGAINDKN